MNIQALNANPTLGRRQVPRNNNVSFGAKLNRETLNGAKDAALNTLGTVKNKAGNGAKKAFEAVSAAASQGAQKVAKFISEHKGAKGIKLVATALTAIVAGAFAIKEIYDIVTKSNPER